MKAEHNYMIFRGAVNKIAIVEFDGHLNQKSTRLITVKNKYFKYFNTNRYRFRVQLVQNKIYIFQNDSKHYKSTVLVLTWDDAANDYENKFSAEPKYKVYRLKKYYDDFYFGRHMKFNYLKRYKGLYAVEIVKEVNISKISNKHIIRLKIPHSEKRGFKFVESGFGTIVIESPDNHLSIIHRYNHRVGIKVIPRIEMPDNQSILNKVIFIQTQELIYYLYLYKSYKKTIAGTYPQPSASNEEDSDDDEDEEDDDEDTETSKECGLLDLPHIQVYHKDSKII